MIVKINAAISSFIAFSVFCSVMFRKLAKKSGCRHIPGPVFKILVSLSAKKVKAAAAAGQIPHSSQTSVYTRFISI